MKKYLVVCDINGIQNLSVHDAPSKRDACDMARKDARLVEETFRFFKAYVLDDLNNGWSYYISY